MVKIESLFINKVNKHLVGSELIFFEFYARIMRNEYFERKLNEIRRNSKN